jgi:hypothetical protein
MLPSPTPPTKGKAQEKNESYLGEQLMDLAEDGSEEGTSTPSDSDACMVPLAPTEAATGTNQPVLTKTKAGTTLPEVIEKDAVMTSPGPTQ